MSSRLDPELVKNSKKSIGTDSMIDTINQPCENAIENRKVFNDNKKSFGKYPDWKYPS